MKKILFGLLLLIASVARAQTFPVNNLTVAGSATFANRPVFNGNTPWDSGNLPSPVSSVSPTFTGAPTAPVAVQGTNTGQLATTSFVAQHAPCPSIVDYGGDPTGVADNSTAWTSTLAASSAGNKCVFFPSGTYSFSSAISYTMTASVEAVTILGVGADKSILKFPSGNGLTLNYLNQYSSSHIRDLSFVTATIGGGTALKLNQTASSISNPALNALSDITGVSFRGFDGYVINYYWNNAVSISGVSNVNFYGDSFSGNAASGGNGQGILIAGTAALPPVAFNIVSCNFEWNNTGIQYGNYVQGVSVVSSNFVGGTYGIVTQSSLTNLNQLTVTSSQFNQSNTNILENTNISNTMIIGNEFIVQTGAIGISLPAAGFYAITGNTIAGNTTTNTNGIVINNSTASGIITGNAFFRLNTGVFLQSGSSGANLQANSYISNSNNYVNNGSNSVGVATP